MTDGLTDHQLKKIYEGPFREYRSEDWAEKWRASYVSASERVQKADRATWIDPAFQRFLWDENPVSSIGPGNSVTVSSAYADTNIAGRIFELRNDPALTTDLGDRGTAIQSAYDEILGMVYQHHAKRRPKARLIRLLALMYPRDMTCLMDAPRVWGVHRLIGAQRLAGDFVAQHAAIRARIREAVGTSDDFADLIDQSVFSWFLWESKVKRVDEGAIVVDRGPREAHDLPAISLLPASAQRRSLTSVRDNVPLLVAMVREAEQGISREDLTNIILSEATHLNASSAGNIISQAQGGLGLIQLENGTYKPTARGLELLTAADPAEVLRAPLVGRVFGVGHLLRMLSASPDKLSPTEAAQRLQALVPSWTTTQPGSHIVGWTRVTGLVQADAGGRLRLTEDGEAYAAALPDDFETRWTIGPSAAPDDSAEDTQASDTNQKGTYNVYDVASIIGEGCFISDDQITAMLAALRRKKNLVLQGPPGTGKTWLAKRLGYALIGTQDPARLFAMQFQPSLSYEDFVRGWRPDGTGGLKLVDGAFLEAVHSANADRARPFVLVIEEINRGNPAQIFGELLTLLETDKRDKREALRLAYPRTLEERVYIPENLYIVGTMNLADRSLALVDLALRRRFAFMDLKPELGEKWRSWCVAKGAPDDVLAEIERRMLELNALIEGDRSLGPQFKVGHSFVTPPNTLNAGPASVWRAWFDEVVRTEIGPLLAEYWYEDRDLARDKAQALLFNP